MLLEHNLSKKLVGFRCTQDDVIRMLVILKSSQKTMLIL